ncbi:MAG: cytochrome c [Cyclobacteriaceae bacterium]|nr:cytochrome c [Cyclobacteriaceae bacterium]
MKTSNVFIQLSLLFFVGSLLMSTQMKATQEPWPVPANFVKMANPTDAGDDENLEIGKQLYIKHCKSCHGKDGLGDGPKAAELETPSGDFSMDEFQKQSDGSLFYKITKGRDDMPAFDKKVPSDEDRWLIVNYLRTMAE